MTMFGIRLRLNGVIRDLFARPASEREKIENVAPGPLRLAGFVRNSCHGTSLTPRTQRRVRSHGRCSPVRIRTEVNRRAPVAHHRLVERKPMRRGKGS
jgi:hypothetical protein